MNAPPAGPSPARPRAGDGWETEIKAEGLALKTLADAIAKVPGEHRMTVRLYTGLMGEWPWLWIGHPTTGMSVGVLLVAGSAWVLEGPPTHGPAVVLGPLTPETIGAMAARLVNGIGPGAAALFLI